MPTNGSLRVFNFDKVGVEPSDDDETEAAVLKARDESDESDDESVLAYRLSLLILLSLSILSFDGDNDNESVGEEVTSAKLKELFCTAVFFFRFREYHQPII